MAQTYGGEARHHLSKGGNGRVQQKNTERFGGRTREKKLGGKRTPMKATTCYVQKQPKEDRTGMDQKMKTASEGALRIRPAIRRRARQGQQTIKV